MVKGEGGRGGNVIFGKSWYFGIGEKIFWLIFGRLVIKGGDCLCFSDVI